ncbi:AraC family transcriptional regulator [Agrobacterium vitis]|uniref:helix-turn-helix transcriptional regulator n=1 Tax=Agrobacterium vitis TaxID=373 RepID=UPI0018D215F9|nr:AraC family transcriptional regulator [Agrobacterium vitis]
MGLVMSAHPFQIDDRIHRTQHGAASMASQHIQVTQLLAHAVSLVEKDEEGAIDLIKRASALFGNLFGDLDISNEPEPSARGSLAPWQAERVKQHIDKECARRINNDDLARITRLSTGYFSAAFRASFGTTPHDYISRRRIDHAKQLMLTTDTPLCEIAIACGFADQSHFCRVFRRITGQTPAAWRRNSRVA